MPPLTEDEAPRVPQATRDEIAEAYFAQLPFQPYPVQEEALFAWYTSQQGVLVCAPTGTGKTLIAEAAIFEALQLNRKAYYTTPLIALTDQKYRELKETVMRWGYSPDVVGLVTGNRKLNPDAPIQVVVAEILLNRLLDPGQADWPQVWAVVMDEFHSFNDPERGIVWEFGLSLLPPQVKTLLLSATVGNSNEFVNWLKFRHDRSLMLVQSGDRKIPLTYQWVEDQTLPEQLELMFDGDPAVRLTPALVFCFNRDQCWTVAELFKGKALVTSDQKQQLLTELDQYDWSQGAGPKLKQILQRGIGVHHAGVLPRYRRIVEDLFQKKLLSVAVCTETLAAGINLPARSVVLPTLMKGPFNKKTLVEPSSAQQMFGRAGRPQFDDRGYVVALAHEDDVKYFRWKEKFDQIPADTKDAGLLKAKKQLKKKMPRRRDGVVYWTQKQFEQLQVAKSANLESRGPIPWQLLAYMLNLHADVDLLRQLIGKRLLSSNQMEQQYLELNRRLVALWRGRFIELEPPPPFERDDLAAVAAVVPPTEGTSEAAEEEDEFAESEPLDEEAGDDTEHRAAAGQANRAKLSQNASGKLGPKQTGQRDAARSREPAAATEAAAAPVFGGWLAAALQPPTPAKSAPPAAEPERDPVGPTAESESAATDEPELAFAKLSGENANKGLFNKTGPSGTTAATNPAANPPASVTDSVTDSVTASATDSLQANVANRVTGASGAGASGADAVAAAAKTARQLLLDYRPQHARANLRLDDFIRLRAIHPVFGIYLIDLLAGADDVERIMAVESLLEMPASVGSAIRVPWPEELPLGPLALEQLHPRLLRLGLATVEELVGRPPADEEDDAPRVWTEEPPAKIISLPFKIQRLFQYDNPGIDDVKVKPVWVIGRLREFNWNFNNYITSYKLQKQEGMIFRHLLRGILLFEEVAEVGPRECDYYEWSDFWYGLADAMIDCCQQIDATSTEEILSETRQRGKS